MGWGCGCHDPLVFGHVECMKMAVRKAGIARQKARGKRTEMRCAEVWKAADRALHRGRNSG
jgi:hypothetical protein